MYEGLCVYKASLFCAYKVALDVIVKGIDVCIRRCCV